MGMILNTILFLKAMASGDYPTRKLNKPCIIKLALDSPGWTLAPTIMYFLNL